MIALLAVSWCVFAQDSGVSTGRKDAIIQIDGEGDIAVHKDNIVSDQARTARFLSRSM